MVSAMFPRSCTVNPRSGVKTGSPCSTAAARMRQGIHARVAKLRPPAVKPIQRTPIPIRACPARSGSTEILHQSRRPRGVEIVWLLVAAAALGPEVWSDVHAVPGGQWTDSWNSLWSMALPTPRYVWPWWADAEPRCLPAGCLGWAVAAVPVLSLDGLRVVQLALSGWAMQGLAAEWAPSDAPAADRGWRGWAMPVAGGAACGTSEAVAGAPPVLLPGRWRARGVILAGVALLVAALASDVDLGARALAAWLAVALWTHGD